MENIELKGVSSTFRVTSANFFVFEKVCKPQKLYTET